MTDLKANIGRNVHEVQKELEEQGKQVFYEKYLKAI